MQKSFQISILLLIFFLVFGLRLLVAFSYDYPSFEAFDDLRHVQSIKETGHPIIHDELSYGGREKIVSPLYNYVLAGFSFFLDDFYLIKIIPNLFASLIVFPVFLLVNYMTGKPFAALISSFFSGIIPSSFGVGVIDGSSLSLTIPLIFLSCFLFLKSPQNSKHFRLLFFVLVFMSLINVIGIVLLLTFLLYLFLIKIVGLKSHNREKDVVFFFLFFLLWIIVVIYKRAFVLHGPSVIWQNIPLYELNYFFSNFDLSQVFLGAGVIPLILGTAGLYFGLVQSKKKSLLLLSSLLIVTTSISWLKLISFQVGIYFLSVVLCVASGYGIFLFWNFLKKTVISSFAPAIVVFVFLLFLITSVPFIFSYATTNVPSKEEMDVLSWSFNNVKSDKCIIAPSKYGSLITYVTGLCVVSDSDYLLANNVLEREKNVRDLYNSIFTIDVIHLMEKYNSDFLFVSSYFENDYKRKSEDFSEKYPVFVEDDCFVVLDEVSSKNGFSSIVKKVCSLKGGRS